MPDEAADLTTYKRFRNVSGLENKYFALTLAGASRYAARAASAFGDGPFTLVTSAIQDRLITWPLEVKVDGGIPTLVVPTKMLRLLSPPTIVGVL